MKTIKGSCHTNLDNYDTSHVTEFARVPNINEKVSVRYNGQSRTLKVVQITHDFKDNKPFIHVELYK